MDGDSFGALFDVLMWAGCVYCLYSWLWMRKNGRIHDNPFLLPPRLAVEECTDVQGYINFLSPRLCLFSIAGTCLGGLNWYGNHASFPRALSLAVLALLFANIVWFAIAIRGAQRAFWKVETIQSPRKQ